MALVRNTPKLDIDDDKITTVTGLMYKGKMYKDLEEIRREILIEAIKDFYVSGPDNGGAYIKEADAIKIADYIIDMTNVFKLKIEPTYRGANLCGEIPLTSARGFTTLNDNGENEHHTDVGQYRG